MNHDAAPLIIGVTSHRNIPAREVGQIRQRVREFFARLQGDFPNVPLVVLSSLAEGGDQCVAEEALAAGVRLVAPLPMARAQYAQDFEAGKARNGFDALCEKAQVIEVPAIPGSSLRLREDSPEGRERDLHYAQAGVYISQHCHILLAIWDGKLSDRLGGTAQIVNFHLTGIKPAQAERRRSAARSVLVGSDSERLAYHIVCSREEESGDPAPPLQAGQVFWRTGEEVLPGDEPMPQEFRTMFASTAKFNADWATYATPIEAETRREPGENGGAALPIDRLFAAADWLAIHFQRRVLFAMRSLYVLAALMGIAFTIYDNLPQQDYMLFVFLLLFALGGVVVVLANRREWHRKYLDYRALAEGLRVQRYWRRAGLSITGDSEFARDNFLQKQDVELGWIRNVMRSAGLESAIGEQDVAAGELGAVIAEWVGDAERGGQLEYYQRKAAQRARTHRITESIGTASLCVGIGISVMLAVLASQLSPDAKNILVMTMAVFSIVAGVREAYAYKKADKELIKQYRYMQRLFSDARAALTDAGDATEQREILRLLGEAALAEHVEWALMHRARPLEHSKI